MNALVKGGVPPRTSVLLSGPPGSGKTTLAMQLLSEHLDAGGTGLVVSTELAPDQVLDYPGVATPPRKLATRDGEPALWILDAYSWRTRRPSTEANVIALPNLSGLSDLSIVLADALERATKPGRPLMVLFDTPSTLALHAGVETLLKFLDLAFARVKDAGGALLVPIERGVHPENFLTSLSFMCDGVLELRLEEEKDDLARYVRIQTMRTAVGFSSRWTKLILAPEGVELVAA